MPKKKKVKLKKKKLKVKKKVAKKVIKEVPKEEPAEAVKEESEEEFQEISEDKEREEQEIVGPRDSMNLRDMLMGPGAEDEGVLDEEQVDYEEMEGELKEETPEDEYQDKLEEQLLGAEAEEELEMELAEDEEEEAVEEPEEEEEETPLEIPAVKGKTKAPSVKEDKVKMCFKALHKILRHGIRFSNPNHPRGQWVECMGFLVGNVDDRKVEIKDAIPIVHGNLVEVEFADQHYAKADEINQDLTDENWIVGWYHTHPGHGLFLSPVDKVNHSGYQTLNPKAVALVFDPSKFNSETKMSEYLRIFRLDSPELREKSEFTQIENIEIEAPFGEIMASLYETAKFSDKDTPLILEYGEEFKRPVERLSKEIELYKKQLSMMQKQIKSLHKEIKVVNEKLSRHAAKSTEKDVDELLAKRKKKKRKESNVCEFCGYDSISPGDTICASCGVRL